MRNILSTLFSVSVISVSCFFNAMADDAYWSLENSRLSGILTNEIHYGPPGFGENPDFDQKIIVPVLMLRRPFLKISKDDVDKIREIDKIQLIKPDKIEMFAGKCVEVTGQIKSATLPTEFTNYVLVINNILTYYSCK